MPGQRKHGKRSISFWLTEDEQRMLEEAAERLGVNKSDLLKRAVEEIATRVGVTKEPPAKDDDHGNND